MSAFEPRPENVYVDFICPWPNRTKIGSFISSCITNKCDKASFIRCENAIAFGNEAVWEDNKNAIVRRIAHCEFGYARREI